LRLILVIDIRERLAVADNSLSACYCLCLSGSGEDAPMKASGPTVNRLGTAFSVVVGVIVIALFLVASVKVIPYLANAEDTVERYMSKNCSQLEQSGLEAKWEYGEGCLVNIDGRWVPEREVPK
jgi:hypothetical protein